jgi:hypothetical protein
MYICCGNSFCLPLDAGLSVQDAAIRDFRIPLFSE